MNIDERVRAAMTDLADGPLPADLAGRAMAGARQGRIRLYAGVAAAGVATVALVASMVIGLGRHDPATEVGGNPSEPPGNSQWRADVDRLEAEVLPMVERLELSYYILEPNRPLDRGPCLVLEYSRGDYLDGDPECGDLVPFDSVARADFDELTAAVERTGVTVERIFRHEAGIYVQLEDNSWQFNYQYVYMRGVHIPPATNWPGEEWDADRGDWWFFRAHDD